MFSAKEKEYLAGVVEKAILSLNHPEIDPEKIDFDLFIRGRAAWSFAKIHSNSQPPIGPANPWNEISRKVLGDENQ